MKSKMTTSAEETGPNFHRWEYKKKYQIEEHNFRAVAQNISKSKCAITKSNIILTTLESTSPARVSESQFL